MTNTAETGAPPRRPPARIDGPSAWTGPEMRAHPERWLLQLQDDDLREIDDAIRRVQASGLELADITPATFALPRLAGKLQGVLDRLLEGCGFTLIRGFQVQRYSLEQAAIAYLGIGAHLGGFRSQNAKGHLLGHVTDLGADITKPTTRYYQTNRGLEFHTDSCDIVGLICLRTSKSGGESRIVSSVTLYNTMRARHPELCEQLFHAFPTDRRGEIPEGQLPWFDVPVFNWHDGRLTTIYVGQYIRSAQQNFPQARRLTVLEVEALDTFDALTNDEALNLKMEFAPGDMQFLHNHQVLHARTDFEDWPEPERRRHLLRLWLAPRAGRALPPAFAARYGDLTPGHRGGIITRETRLKFTLVPE